MEKSSPYLQPSDSNPTESLKILVIFDVDGTLVYSDRVDSHCFADTYQQLYARPFPSIDWQRYPHVSDHVIFNCVIEEHFGRQAEEEEIHVFQNHFVQNIEERRLSTPEEFFEVPNARRMVELLLEDGRFAVGIGTGGWLRPAKVKLSHVGIPVEQLHLSGADFQPTREHIVQEAIRQAKEVHRDFARIVYVGDATWDVQTTRQMGLPFIGIRRNGDREVLVKEGASIVLEDFRQEEKFLDAIFTAPTPDKNPKILSVGNISE